jgi:hypothetical protein
MNIQKINILGFIAVLLAFLMPFHKTQALTVSPVRFEISGNPGETIQKEVTLYNEQDTTKTVYPDYKNFQAQGESGTPSFVDPKDGLGTWMAAPGGITLEKRESKKITFLVTIPENAEPGGYFAALLFGTIPPNEKGTNLSIGSETGPLVLLRVNGDIKESASILEFSTLDKKSFYTALPVEMFYRFQNGGNDRVKPIGSIILNNLGIIRAKSLNANIAEGNILPGQIRRFDVSWKKDGTVAERDESKSFIDNVRYEWNNFAFGYFTANLKLTYGVDGVKSTEGKTNFFVFPWHLLIIIFILLIILYLLFKTFVKHYNRYLISQAEEMIKEEQRESKHSKKV